MTPILVLAIGNPLRGDDGVAQRVLEVLKGQDLGIHVALVDAGTAGLEVANLLRGWQMVIIVDAIDCAAPAGTVRCITLDVERIRSVPVWPNALHSAGLFEALALAEALGVLPERLTLVGVQPGNLDYVDTLTPEVQAAVPLAVDAVRAVINDYKAQQN